MRDAWREMIREFLKKINRIFTTCPPVVTLNDYFVINIMYQSDFIHLLYFFNLTWNFVRLKIILAIYEWSRGMRNYAYRIWNIIMELCTFIRGASLRINDIVHSFSSYLCYVFIFCILTLMLKNPFQACSIKCTQV